jgi:hypothetical protein
VCIGVFDQNAGQNWDINIGNRLLEGTVQTFGNDSNKLKFGSGGN